MNNRRDRRARGEKGKKGDQTVIESAIKLARQLEEKKQFTEAKKLYRKILEYDPDNIIALLDIGVDALEKGTVAEAEAIFTKILRIEPGNNGALTCMGVVRLDQGRREEALKYAEKALRTNPTPGALNRLSVLYRNAGQIDRARDLLYQVLRIRPDDIIAYYTLQGLTKFTPEDLENMTRISKKKDLPLVDKISVEFTLAKACLDVGQGERAFWHLAEANLLKRATYKYNLSFFEKYVDGVIEMFDEKAVARLRGKSSVKSNMPIFVVGMPRSGSSLVDQILSSHPDVGSVGEARFMSRCVPFFPNREVPGYFNPGVASITRKLLEDMDTKMLDEIGGKYLAQMEPFAAGAPRVVDKMLFNYTWLGLIRLAMPEAKIIHCMRDPVDIGFSIWQLQFSDDIPWAYDLREIGRYYRTYEKLMAHWRKLFPGEFYEVSYETIVADQENETRKLLEYCGLPWNDACLKFHETTRQVKTASSTQVRKPIYKDSVKKWKKYEKQLKPLIDTIEGKNLPNSP